MDSVADRRDMLRALGGKEYQAVAGPLLGVFDAPFMEAGNTEVSDSQLTCVAEDAAASGMDKKGAQIEIEGTTFTVRRQEPDGTGITRLILG